MLLVADERELPSDARVWGTGGWLPPDQREALDWLTLARFSGWDVNIARRLPAESAGVDTGTRWIVIACDPDALSEQDVARLTTWLIREAIVVVAEHYELAPPDDVAPIAGAAQRNPSITSGTLRRLARWCVMRILSLRKRLTWSNDQDKKRIPPRPEPIRANR